MKHTHPEKFTWLPSPRVHKGKGRIFMLCSQCTMEFQGTVGKDGAFKPFITNWKKNTGKKTHSFWCTKKQAIKIRSMLKRGEI